MGDPATVAERGTKKDYVHYDFANSILLSRREWIGLALLLAALYIAVPRAWKSIEKLEPGPDYRMPYELSNDYWLFGRWAERAAASHDTLVVGDSVVWGEYVRPDETLPHWLNELAGRKRFANLGLNGMQPVTMPVLFGSFAPSLAEKKVLLHLNPLWMTSDLRDLTVSDPQRLETFKLNHPALVPQFAPWIGAHKADTSRRMSYVVQRNLEFSAWTNHLQVAYYDSESMLAWTLEHPYENPLKPVTLRLPSPSTELRHGPSDPITGTWKGTLEAPEQGVKSELTAQLKLDGTRVIGTLQSQVIGTQPEKVEGAFEGGDLRIERVAQELKAEISLRLAAADYLRGTWKVTGPGVELRGTAEARRAANNWKEQGIAPQAFEWVDPATSLQWKSFRSAVEGLQSRGCRVFVLVGPFNEHMIAPEGQPRYLALKAAVEAWLKERAIPHLLPEVLPSELYGDASHPFAPGYRELARRLWAHEFFR